MYQSIPAVEPEVVEPKSIDEMEATGIQRLYMFVPLMDISRWEHHGYHRAHTVDNCTCQGIAICCMYHKESWDEWFNGDTP